MNTLRAWSHGLDTLPAAAAWQLEALGEARGRQALFTRQSPQRLRALREHAIVESAVASNRIEGIEVERARVGTLVFGRSAPRDRDEEELRGYRKALEWIHRDAASIDLGEETARELHRLVRGDIWDAGQYKAEDGEIVERYPDGRSRVRFRPVAAAATPAAMAELYSLAARAGQERWASAPLLAAAANLDFLCIHPFRDGNGRVSRLLWLLESYRLGLEVGRYVSLERLVEQDKQGYYDALERSSLGWHEGRHDPWPYVLFVLSVWRAAYRELEARLGDSAEPRGSKRARVRDAILALPGSFALDELRTACPGVSDETLRKALKELRDEGRIECLGRGVKARWRKKK